MRNAVDGDFCYLMSFQIAPNKMSKIAFSVFSRKEAIKLLVGGGDKAAETSHVFKKITQTSQKQFQAITWS